MAEKYYRWSPYVFCADNPVNVSDLEGNAITIANNSRAVLRNIARIAATQIGYDRLNTLIMLYSSASQANRIIPL